MVKTIYSILISILILAFAGVGEQIYLKRTFDSLHEDFTMAYLKIKDEKATTDDANAIRTRWIAQKKKLHFFISHNDIKEMDLWLSEAVSYLKLGNVEEAVSKLEVAIHLTEQIPQNYLIRFENIL